MSNEVIVNETKKKAVSENKVCAILHAISALCWAFCAGLNIYNIVKYGGQVGGTIITDIGLTIVFGSLSVSYLSKYLKEKKNADN